jgi:hypothetical protein
MSARRTALIGGARHPNSVVVKLACCQIIFFQTTKEDCSWVWNKDRSHQRSVQSARDQGRRMAASVKNAAVPEFGDNTNTPRLR